MHKQKHLVYYSSILVYKCINLDLKFDFILEFCKICILLGCFVRMFSKDYRMESMNYYLDRIHPYTYSKLNEMINYILNNYFRIAQRMHRCPDLLYLVRNLWDLRMNFQLIFDFGMLIYILNNLKGQYLNKFHKCYCMKNKFMFANLNYNHQHRHNNFTLWLHHIPSSLPWDRTMYMHKLVGWLCYFNSQAYSRKNPN